MAEFHLSRSAVVGRPLEEVFAFFSDARNLEALTPPWVGFRILTPTPITMEVGRLIDYRIRIRGLPVRWTTEITVWDPPHRFVDEQLRGPYRLWVHEHRFESRGDETVVTDNVRYAVFGGRLVNRLFVRRDVERIFDYRAERLPDLFR
jgi:ligand-binding SRPBCC domain-containing protein